MPRQLILNLDGTDIPVTIRKIDRDDLYGEIDIEAFDEKGNPASLMMLASDGKTLIDKGGSALAVLDRKGNSIERDSLRPVDLHGNEIEPVKSSFETPSKLSKAVVDEYLALIVKSVYLLEPVEDEKGFKALKDLLGSGQIFKFDFSYRGGVDFDSAFVVGNKSDAFMIVGRQAEFRFAKLNQTAALYSVEEQEISADELDFDLM